jgi:hypothetical protein
MVKVPLKKHWVWVDAGWRGYDEYENSVFGGSLLFGDEAHNEDEKEKIKKAKEILKKNRIPYRFKTSATSNVFSKSYDIIVAKENNARAKKLIKSVI